MTDSSATVGAGRESGDGEAVTDVAPMLAVYRHDTHKLRGRSHASARDRVAGVRVNETVPLGADGRGAAVRELVCVEDPVAMHEAWLSSDVAGLFNESLFYPYTSLKYHTLLAAALLDNYRAGFGFEELFLAVETPDGPVTPHRTVLSTPVARVCVTGEPGDRPAVRLGDGPARCFADVWARLPAHPIDVDGQRRWRVLDAQLRRIRSWSAALQFVEEFCRRFDPGGGAGRGGSRGGER